MKMNKNKLDKIRETLINRIIKNPRIMFSDEIRGSDELQENEIDLIEIIVDLYEYLHKEVLHEEYNYFFHYANKIGSDIDTGEFDKLIEKELNENEKQY